MLLRRRCPCACPSSSAVASSKRITISFSRYYLVTRPFTGAINCLQSRRRHRSSSSSWHPRRRSVAFSREVERRHTGQIRLTDQLPMCSAVHLRPSLPKNNSENVWELEAFELQQTSTSWPMNSCAIGVAVQCRPRRHFLPSLSPATEREKLVYCQRIFPNACQEHRCLIFGGLTCQLRKDGIRIPNLSPLPPRCHWKCTSWYAQKLWNGNPKLMRWRSCVTRRCRTRAVHCFTSATTSDTMLY